ncbi:hypothetical protein [[Micrococcus luteus] ATCC 49442]|uniref:hypothetical protein n=1 Tax=[Micrococcus luteus] ATCC 49442 TaxID=2698727 RepID=UPI0013DD17ED|nr:hypothetical protein [[Micrococcus luteus] ATCC 49442]
MLGNGIVTTFPSDDHTLIVLFASPDDAAWAYDAGLQLLSGRPARAHGRKPDSPTEIVLAVEAAPKDELVVDQVVVGDRVVGPRFVHGVKSPMELKVPYTETRFPYGPTLASVHVSVACCTGCNGGIHDRGLVVLNSHTGGGWSGIWVRSDIDMPSDYARWQKVAFLGGVLRDDSGSTTVRDEGWMRVRLAGEEPHDAPTPTRVSAADFPAEGTRSLLSRSLEASWVELVDARVIDARRVEPAETDHSSGVRLPRMELRVTDGSGGESAAWLYQASAFDLTSGARIARLRGFLHAEAPGLYVLLGDKEEDLLTSEILEPSTVPGAGPA